MNDGSLKLEGGLKLTGKSRIYLENFCPAPGGGAKKQPPLVSIITIVYNGARYLESTLESVLTQNYKRLEYIIIDGGSTDGTIDIIKKYEDRIDYWLSEKDGGISDAMNKGIALATGEIIGMIHAGDWYEPGVISVIAGTYMKYSPDIICGSLRLWQDGKPYYESDSDTDGLDYAMSVWHPTVFVRSSVYKQYGVFNLKYKIAMDYDIMLRFKKSGRRFLNMPGFFISNMSRGGVSETSRAHGLAEEYEIKLKYGVNRLKVLYDSIEKYFLCCTLQSIKRTVISAGGGPIIDLLKKIRNRYDKRFIN